MSQYVHRGFRVPTNPALILPERRAAVEVDAMRTPEGQRKTIDSLSPRERTLFAAQLAAWQAGCALVRELDAAEDARRWHPITSEQHKRFLDSIAFLSGQWRTRRDEWAALR